MNTVFKKYGAGIAGFLIVILTAVGNVKEFNLVTVLQLLALFLSTLISVGIIGLLPGKWPGVGKTLVDLGGAAIALILPYAISHGITWNEIILVVIGVIKAAATEFGVQIRTDSITVGSAEQVLDVKALPESVGTPMTPGTYK